MNTIEGTRQLAEAARQIGHNYSRSDQFAKIKSDDVTKVLPAGTPDTTPSAPPSVPTGGGGAFIE